MVDIPLIPVPGKLRQEHHKFETRAGGVTQAQSPEIKL
jgi:hypothetical protein